MPQFSDEEKDYLSEPRIARIATCGADGPHVAPVWFERTGSSIVVTTNANSKKVRNLEDNPEAAVTVDGSDGGYENHGVIVRGPVIVAEDEGYRHTRSVFNRYLDSLDDPYTEKVLESDRVYVQVTAEEIISWGLG